MKFPAALVFAFMASAAYAQTATQTVAAGQSTSSANPFKINADFKVTAGTSASITWTPTTSGTVSLILRSGASNNLNAGTPIAQNIANSGSYTWNVPASITKGTDYTIEIVSADGQTNYSPYIFIDSTNTVASITNPSSSSATVTVTSSGSRSASGSASSASASASASSAAVSSAASSGSVTVTSGSSTITTRSTTSASANSATTSSSSSRAGNAAPRATAAAGVLGAVAMAALAL